MEIGETAAFVGVTILALNFAWTVYWSIRMKRVVDDARNDSQVKNHHDRLTVLETRFEHVPNQDTIEILHRRIGDLQKKVSNLCAKEAATREAVDGLKRSVDFLVKHELGEVK